MRPVARTFWQRRLARRLPKSYWKGSWSGAAAIGLGALIVALIYLSTMMWHVNGSDSDYAVDVGEFQVALPLWGTVHHTGYPTYTLLGSPFVTVLRWFGIAPAAGASLYSLVWETLGVALAATLLIRLTRRPLLGVAAAIAAGLTLSVWIHGVIAEVYSLSLALTLAMLLLAIQLRSQWSDRKGWLLAFVAGLGVSHHRLVALLIPILALWLYYSPARSGGDAEGGRAGMPQGRSLLRWVAIASLAFLAGFLPYVDMVLRARLGLSDWHYGYVGTWGGFWWVFWGTEVRGLQQPLTTLPELLAAARQVGRVLWGELHLPGLILVLIGAPPALRDASSRRVTLLFLAVAFVYTAFAIIFVEAVLLAAVLLPVTVGLLLAAAVGLANLADRFPRLLYPLTGSLALLAVFYFAANRAQVLEITRNPAGLEYIARLDDLRAPEGATIMAPWGRRYFAVSYANRVEQRFPQWTFVDHRAPFRDLLRQSPAIYTNVDTFYIFGLDWWEQILEGRPYLSAAGPGWAAISDRPLPVAVEHSASVPLADAFVLAGWTIEEQVDTMEVNLCWQVTRLVTTDYSTFVYAATAPQVAEPQQLVAQTDHFAPVDGWNPTSRWTPDEVVCDVHKVPLPPEADFGYIIAGMYSRDAEGNFRNLGEFHWTRDGSRWALEP